MHTALRWFFQFTKRQCEDDKIKVTGQPLSDASILKYFIVHIKHSEIS